MIADGKIRLLQRKACVLRKHIVRMVRASKTGHLGGSCSCADIVAALYFSEMNVDSSNPTKPDRDRLILSKGHSALAQYAALAELGYFPLDELDRIKRIGAVLQGHPDLTRTPGIEANTGSLGQGLSIANGMALAARLDGMQYRIYVIIGDGEIDEGQVWEAAMFAAFHKLDLVVAILDKNGIQGMGFTKDSLDTTPLGDKWRSFGWNVIEINGHDMEQVLSALDQAKHCNGKPTIIIAETVKGKGISFAENSVGYHNVAITQEQYDTAIRELDAALAGLPCSA
jgi:transketolase